ncbi:uncharacterized protein LOC134667605 [Cydia fagiglandana]|uniref:uncharacterized protein LOC134667605 n=1 Tax=Cydia fagiglandana TaxID=1458189 RepID=UPI002FEDFD25
MFHVVFICSLIFHIPDIDGTVYTVANATDKFTDFKLKYNKQYKNLFDESNHYLAFVNNLNAAAALNATSQGSKTVYVMNKYADLDPAEVEESYAIHLKTYDAVKEGDHQEALRSDHGIEINDDNLFNLKDSDELFQKYIEEEHRSFKDKRDGFLHFYRFVKTLAQKNRGIYEGSDTPDLGHSADILTQSKEFFY